MTDTDLRARLTAELARHHRTLRTDGALTECKCGAWYADIDEHLAEALLPVLDAEPAQPSPDHSAIYLDQDDHVWSDYPTVPSGDYVVPLVWASKVAESRVDLADEGTELRVIGWCAP